MMVKSLLNISIIDEADLNKKNNDKFDEFG